MSVIYEYLHSIPCYLSVYLAQVMIMACAERLEIFVQRKGRVILISC